MTSFKKAGRAKVVHPRGTKPSLHNSQLLISSGTPSLDTLLGGLAIGTVLLVEEDAYNAYASFLVKYFLAEGVMCGHALFVAGPSIHTGDILKELPASVGSEMTAHPSSAEPGPQAAMDIAWRYQNLPVVKSERNALRILISSFGSPLWSKEYNNPVLLSQFLHSLRASVRGAYAAAVVTVPNHLLQDESLVRRFERLCDAAVALESFSGSAKEENPLYKDYHGLFHVRKLPCLNCLTPQYPETLELGFKLYRKKFSIEKLHLPPELSDTANRAQEDITRNRSTADKQNKNPNKYNINF